MNGWRRRAASAWTTSSSRPAASQISERDQAGDSPLHRLGLQIRLAELFGDLAGLGQHLECLLQAAVAVRPVGPHQHGREPEPVAEPARHRDRPLLDLDARLEVAGERVGAREARQQHHAKLRVLRAERDQRLVEEPRGSCLRPSRTPARILEADRGRREQFCVSKIAGDLRRVLKRLHRAVGVAGPETGGPELELRLRSPAWIVDPQLERVREARFSVFEVERRERGTARQERVLDRASRSVDRRRRAEVMRKLGEAAVVARFVCAFERLGNLEVQLGAPEHRHAVIQRPSHELVGEPDRRAAAIGASSIMPCAIA